MEKFLNYLALGTSLVIAGIAAYFSVLGLATIFAGAWLSVVIMTGVLEFGKIVTAAYLHLFWERLNYMKYYLTLSVFILMLITSLGIFGFLSKANIEQTLKGDSFSLEMSIIEKRIEGEEGKLERLETRLEGLDLVISTAQPKDRNYIDRRQKEERDLIAQDMNVIIEQVVKYNEELMPLKREQLMQEGEIGPIKYVAEVIYGQEESVKYLDNAVRWVIFALIFVFDPLAILLLITSTSLIARKIEKDKPKVVENRYVIQVPKKKVPKINKTD
jgi:hypothetical protein